MRRSKTDWGHHLKAFEASGLKVNEYCREAGLNPGTFKSHLYKKPEPQESEEVFEEVAIPSEITIVRSEDGELLLKGFDLSQLSSLIGAWADALSQ